MLGPTVSLNLSFLMPLALLSHQILHAKAVECAGDNSFQRYVSEDYGILQSEVIQVSTTFVSSKIRCASICLSMLLDNCNTFIFNKKISECAVSSGYVHAIRGESDMLYNTSGSQIFSSVGDSCACNDICATDGTEQCDDSSGLVVCTQVTIESVGVEFTLMFMENTNNNDPLNLPVQVYVQAADIDTDTNVTVSTAGLEESDACYFNERQEIKAGEVAEFNIGVCIRQIGTSLKRNSVKVTEMNEKDIIVYAINRERFTTEGYLALPDSATGTEYVTVSYAPAEVATQIGIASFHDHTLVEVVPAVGTIVTFDGVTLIPQQRGRSENMFLLDAMDTLQLQSTVDGTFRKSGYNKIWRGDLTGSRIFSNQSVHVYSGNIRTDIPETQNSRDHLVEELLSVDTWGTVFGIIPLPEREVGDLIKVVSGPNPATFSIYQNEDPFETSYTLSEYSSAQIEIESTQFYSLKSNEPVQVVQFSKSRFKNPPFSEEIHDPSMFLVPPKEQFTTNFSISTPPFSGGVDVPQPGERIPYRYNVLLVVSEEASYTTIALDGDIIPLSNWTKLPDIPGISDGLFGAQVFIDDGAHRLTNSDPTAKYMAIIYGTDDRESYGFAVRARVKKDDKRFEQQVQQINDLNQSFQTLDDPMPHLREGDS